MSEPFLGEIRIFSFGFAPRGWAACNGQIMSIPQNQALYSLLGVIYGGDGRTNFALPNLQGRVPFHFIGSDYRQGKIGGEAAHTLITAEMPGHTHTAMGSAAVADLPSPVSNYWATGTNTAYAAQRSETMSPTALANAGSDQSHDNMSPYLALNFCIALMGIYPTRS
jgi:microcystin-dependent protein